MILKIIIAVWLYNKFNRMMILLLFSIYIILSKKKKKNTRKKNSVLKMDLNNTIIYEIKCNVLYRFSLFCFSFQIVFKNSHEIHNYYTRFI